MKDRDYLISWEPDQVQVKYTDVLILGSGIAGLFTALKLYKDHDVTILTKKDIMAGNTEHAQGGIAVALNEEDSPEFHYGDTIKAGAGLCNLEAVKILAEKGPECVRELIKMGTQFDRLNDELDFTLEAAHSKSRVLHAKGDATGGEIERALVAEVQKHPIKVIENVFVMDLLKGPGGEVTGVLCMDGLSSSITVWLARAVIMATGGLGQIYKYTTNPEVTTGDGIAAAYRAGAELMDMEFIQFHPTALLLAGAPTFLISEAARGEGAKLLNSQGERFMENIPGQELAPRDVVARAIWEQMKDGPVFLDFSSLGAQAQERFPMIYKTCLTYGVDITTAPLSVGPAAHYHMGGIKVNTSGETNLVNLYACGECACSGVHGANRLASNSLLDGLVFASAITEKINVQTNPLPQWEEVKSVLNETQKKQSASSHSELEQKKNQLREIMWANAGIIRNKEGLLKAHNQLKELVQDFIPDALTKELELMNMSILSSLIVDAALSRQESRGGHFRSDFPQVRDEWQKHSVQRKGEEHVRYISI